MSPRLRRRRTEPAEQTAAGTGPHDPVRRADRRPREADEPAPAPADRPRAPPTLAHTTPVLLLRAAHPRQARAHRGRARRRRRARGPAGPRGRRWCWRPCWSARPCSAGTTTWSTGAATPSRLPSGKPIADGYLDPGTAWFALGCGVLLWSRSSITNGVTAGCFYLASVARRPARQRGPAPRPGSPGCPGRRRTRSIPASSRTAAGAARPTGDPPEVAMVALAAALGVGVHVLCALPGPGGRPRGRRAAPAAADRPQDRRHPAARRSPWPGPRSRWSGCSSSATPSASASRTRPTRPRRPGPTARLCPHPSSPHVKALKMQLRRSARLLAAAGALLLAAPVLSSCGFNYATDRPYTPAAGTNDQDGDVDVLGAVVVSAEDGSGTLIATFSNNDDGRAGDGHRDRRRRRRRRLEIGDFDPIEIPPGGWSTSPTPDDRRSPITSRATSDRSVRDPRVHLRRRHLRDARRPDGRRLLRVRRPRRRPRDDRAPRAEDVRARGQPRSSTDDATRWSCSATARASGTPRTSSPAGSTSPSPTRVAPRPSAAVSCCARPACCPTSCTPRCCAGRSTPPPLALDAADRHWIPVRRSWRLNERHYGALQGKNKKQTLEAVRRGAVHALAPLVRRPAAAARRRQRVLPGRACRSTPTSATSCPAPSASRTSSPGSCPTGSPRSSPTCGPARPSWSPPTATACGRWSSTSTGSATRTSPGSTSPPACRWSTSSTTTCARPSPGGTLPRPRGRRRRRCRRRQPGSLTRTDVGRWPGVDRDRRRLRRRPSAGSRR